MALYSTYTCAIVGQHLRLQCQSKKVLHGSYARRASLLHSVPRAVPSYDAADICYSTSHHHNAQLAAVWGSRGSSLLPVVIFMWPANELPFRSFENHFCTCRSDASQKPPDRTRHRGSQTCLIDQLDTVFRSTPIFVSIRGPFLPCHWFAVGSRAQHGTLDNVTLLFVTSHVYLYFFSRATLHLPTTDTSRTLSPRQVESMSPSTSILCK